MLEVAIGISILVVVFILLPLICCICICRCCKKKNPDTSDSKFGKSEVELEETTPSRREPQSVIPTPGQVDKALAPKQEPPSGNIYQQYMKPDAPPQPVTPPQSVGKFTPAKAD